MEPTIKLNVSVCCMLAINNTEHTVPYNIIERRTGMKNSSERMLNISTAVERAASAACKTFPKHLFISRKTNGTIQTVHSLDGVHFGKPKCICVRQNRFSAVNTLLNKHGSL